MMQHKFKICDPIHGFIRFGEIEKKVIDSPPFQRLRSIHQMGVAYLVYPGAVHTRFEHSLGVMELVTRIYQTLIANHNQIIPLDKSVEELEYWLLLLRIAALCHDMGHPPFSHTAEKGLLPEGGHEYMTLQMIRSEQMRSIWREIGPQAEEDLIKLAVSDKNSKLTNWEHVLMQVITEDNFGADRIDYLIRDGYYTGVGYGQFDYHQLIDTLRILPRGERYLLGITLSGIQSVESLWIARYMMYARVYQHPTSRAYSNLMYRFMVRHFEGKMDTDVSFYLDQTDYTLLTALQAAAKRGDRDAECLLYRRRVDEELPIESKKEGQREFLVYTEEGKILSSFEISPFLSTIPHG